jgi:hypothetical protein
MDMGGQTKPRPLYPRERNPGPLIQEVGWPIGPVLQLGKSRPTGIRSPDRPASTESLYRLHSFTYFHQKEVNVSTKQANGRRPHADGISVYEL